VIDIPNKQDIVLQSRILNQLPRLRLILAAAHDHTAKSRMMRSKLRQDGNHKVESILGTEEKRGGE
jgi:hypothetical protein